jgi:hypothetical protein
MAAAIRRWRLVAGLSAAALLMGTVLIARSTATSSPTAHLSRAPSWTAEKHALISELAVLRRPQRKSDLDPALLDGPAFGRTPADTSLMRRATSASGQHVFLVPVRHPGSPGRGGSGLMVFGIGGGSCCVTASEIRSGDAWSTGGRPNRVLMVLPDGVARVTLTLRSGPDPRHPPKVAGKVSDNVIVLRVPFAVETLSGDPITWYGPSGRATQRRIP